MKPPPGILESDLSSLFDICAQRSALMRGIRMRVSGCLTAGRWFMLTVSYTYLKAHRRHQKSMIGYIHKSMSICIFIGVYFPICSIRNASLTIRASHDVLHGIQFCPQRGLRLGKGSQLSVGFNPPSFQAVDPFIQGV